MSMQVARLRMLAGPNGSGKSTLKRLIVPNLPPGHLGVDVNPDEIEANLRADGFLSLADNSLSVSTEQVHGFLSAHALFAQAIPTGMLAQVQVTRGKLRLGTLTPNSYLASILAGLIIADHLNTQTSFICETVMSSRDKIVLLGRAQATGFRTYLYYIATEASDINVSRVALRVEQGGHNVPTDKIVARYERSLGLLPDAIKASNRA